MPYYQEPDNKRKRIVLIVDDVLINRKMLATMLQDEYEILEAENGVQALELLRVNGQAVSAVILDIIMPIMDGYTFLAEKNATEIYRDIPVIVMTESSGVHNEIKALELGAWDFISKPYRMEIIKLRLKNVIARSHIAAFNQLKYLAEYDRLTGVYNRAKFLAATREMLRENSGEQFAFFRFDVNRFSLINSFYGTEEGDRLLCYMGRSMGKFTESLGLATYGRIEADVFCLCTRCQDDERISSIVQYAKEQMKAYNLNYDISLNCGIFRIQDNSLTVNKILDRATLAAKSCKGNYVRSYAVFNEEMQQRLEKEQEIVNAMSTALTEEQFVVYLQPKYDMQTRKPVGAEALVRWMHPVKGMVSPGEFIPIFERNGFISTLDHYMWEHVCKLLRKWMDSGRPVLPVSVNVSRVDMYNPHLPEDIAALTAKYGVPNHLLNLEITESAYTDNPVAMQHAIRRFHDAGFVIMMDDFGSGYSSLNILKEIDIDVLKMDMKFLSGGTDEDKSNNIVAFVLQMAKALDITPIAEGVELEEQAAFLQAHGCRFAQGYLYAKPLPVAAFEALLEQEAVPVG